MPVLLDPALIEQKIIRDGRGGYCYEQNRYLGMVLAALGFDVRLRMARIRWMQPPGTVLQRGHMVLNVAAEGQRYLCDVAFGAMTPTAPLLLLDLADQLTPHQTYVWCPRAGFSISTSSWVKNGGPCMASTTSINTRSISKR